MNTYSIIERLNFHNSWWKDGKVPPVLIPEFHRSIFQTLITYLNRGRAILLKGPRRVGKTTVFYQIINKLLNDKIAPKDICYISFDDPLLRVPLNEIITVYEQFRGKKISTGTTYFFLDEAQFLKDWELTTKLYLDRKYPITFLISGSSTTLLTQKIESLAGRTIEETLFPFSFSEYLSLAVPEFNLSQTQRNSLFPEKLSSSISPFTREIKIQFANYFRKGGFPHLYQEKEELIPKFIKEDILDKVIFRDLVELYKIREPAYLEKLVYYLGKNTSSIINTTTLSQSLGISRAIVEQYISYLERALLYFRLPKFSASLKETLRSHSKGHLIDGSLSNYFGVEKDQQFESIIAAFIFAKYLKKVYFWRDQFHEVDLVIDNDKELIPIEIKNSEIKKIPPGLLYFMEKQKLNKGYVIYHGDFDKIKVGTQTIIFYPAWYFLLG